MISQLAIIFTILSKYKSNANIEFSNDVLFIEIDPNSISTIDLVTLYAYKCIPDSCKNTSNYKKESILDWDLSKCEQFIVTL